MTVGVSSCSLFREEPPTVAALCPSEAPLLIAYSVPEQRRMGKDIIDKVVYNQESLKSYASELREVVEAHNERFGLECPVFTEEN